MDDWRTRPFRGRPIAVKRAVKTFLTVLVAFSSLVFAADDRELLDHGFGRGSGKGKVPSVYVERTERPKVEVDLPEQVPPPGYVWAEGGGTEPRKYPQSLRPRWKEGLSHPDYKNIKSGPTDREWIPEPGYFWRFPEEIGKGLVEVRWTPGIRSALRPGLIAGDNEGEWLPMPGYAWEVPRDGFKVKWVPGSSHPFLPNVVASKNKNGWIPADGYNWSPAIKVEERIMALSVASRHDIAASTPMFSSKGKLIWEGVKWLGKNVLEGYIVDKAIPLVDKGLEKAWEGVERVTNDRRERDHRNAAGERHERQEKSGNKLASQEEIVIGGDK